MFGGKGLRALLITSCYGIKNDLGVCVRGIDECSRYDLGCTETAEFERPGSGVNGIGRCLGWVGDLQTRVSRSTEGFTVIESRT